MSSILPTPTLSAWALFSIPAYYITILAPHIYGNATTVPKLADRKKFDRSNPRNQEALLQKNLTPEQLGRYQRYKAAHQNGHENFPLFVAATIGGMMAGLGEGELKAFVITIVLSRCVYNWAYVKGVPIARSLAWSVGVLWSATTLVRAGLRVL